MAEVQIGEPSLPTPTPRRSLLHTRVTWPIALLVLAAIVACRVWVLEVAIVDGHSMEKTLHSGDRVLVLKLLGLKRFDVVVLTDPQEGEIAIKRVVGFPGDRLSMVPELKKLGSNTVPVGGQLYIDGQPYDEPYATSKSPQILEPRTIRAGRYFVLGDNRDDSVDSRVYAGVDRNLIHGVAVMVIYPLSRIQIIPRTAQPEPNSVRLVKSRAGGREASSRVTPLRLAKGA